MTRYRRCRIPGATYFFTLTLADRSSRLLFTHADLFRDIYREVICSHPVETIAMCLLPDHLHAVWAMPGGDADYAMRWQRIKAAFSRHMRAPDVVSTSKASRKEKGIWQRRFWEHRIRDDDDLRRHVEYIHFNPVKHGLVQRAADWPHSSFHRHVRRGWVEPNWGLSATSDHGSMSFGE